MKRYYAKLAEVKALIEEDMEFLEALINQTEEIAREEAHATNGKTADHLQKGPGW